MEWICLTESRDQLRAVVSTVMNHMVALYASRWFITTRYSRRIVLRVNYESVVSETWWFGSTHVCWATAPNRCRVWDILAWCFHVFLQSLRIFWDTTVHVYRDKSHAVCSSSFAVTFPFRRCLTKADVSMLSVKLTLRRPFHCSFSSPLLTFILGFGA